MRQALFDEPHLDGARSLNNVAVVYDRLGRGQQAVEYAQRALEMKQTLFEGDHPSIANTLDTIGEANYHLAKYDAALSFHTQALAMYKVLFAADHPHVVRSQQWVEKTQRQLAKQVSCGAGLPHLGLVACGDAMALAVVVGGSGRM